MFELCLCILQGWKQGTLAAHHMPPFPHGPLRPLRPLLNAQIATIFRPRRLYVFPELDGSAWPFICSARTIGIAIIFIQRDLVDGHTISNGPFIMIRFMLPNDTILVRFIAAYAGQHILLHSGHTGFHLLLSPATDIELAEITLRYIALLQYLRNAHTSQPQTLSK